MQSCNIMIRKQDNQLQSTEYKKMVRAVMFVWYRDRGTKILEATGQDKDGDIIGTQHVY